MREEMRRLVTKQEIIIGNMAASINDVAKKQQAAIDNTLASMKGGDWEKIKAAWQEYKAGDRTMKVLLGGAAKELTKRFGKVALKKAVSVLTGGIVNL